MKSVTLLHKNYRVEEEPTKTSFFPRVIREFEDDDKPMFWG